MLLEAFTQRRGAAYGLVSLGVFGSFARCEVRDESDVDVVFETDEPNLFRTAVMQAELEALLNRDVDLVRLRERMNPRLRERIEREARYV